MRIGLDAMGGDNAPDVVIEAANKIKDIDIVLIGDKSKLIGKFPESKIIHAPTVATCDDSPQDAFRKKKDCSIAVGTMLQKEGKIDAFVGVGNTGVYVMFSVMWLERIKGIRRPALASFFPTQKGACLVLDVGAVTSAKPEDLYQFALMGTKCVELLTDKKNPSVSILSIGEETGKGSSFTKEAFELMKASKLNFRGNIEGHQIFEGMSDIVVCDGMTGNAVLKVSEGVVELMYHTIRETVRDSVIAKLGGILLLPSLKKSFSKMDYNKYGGAILLGTNGVTIVGHGRSDAEAIKNAVYTAAKYVAAKVNKYIEEFINNSSK